MMIVIAFIASGIVFMPPPAFAIYYYILTYYSLQEARRQRVEQEIVSTPFDAC